MTGSLVLIGFALWEQGYVMAQLQSAGLPMGIAEWLVRQPGFLLRSYNHCAQI